MQSPVSYILGVKYAKKEKEKEEQIIFKSNLCWSIQIFYYYNLAFYFYKTIRPSLSFLFVSVPFSILDSAFWTKFLSKIFAQFPLSWNLKRVSPFVQHVWPNYSRIYLHTACSSCSSQGECFKKKTKTTKNGCKLSMVLSKTIWKSMERRFLKVKN